jgi:hypothetical protein
VWDISLSPWQIGKMFVPVHACQPAEYELIYQSLIAEKQDYKLKIKTQN